MKFNLNYKFGFYFIILVLLIIGIYISYNYQTQQSYNEGYEAGAYYIIGQITTTAQVPYFDNSTGNLTIKYLDLNEVKE